MNHDEKLTAGEFLSAAVLGALGGITLAAFFDYFLRRRKNDKF